MKILITTDTYLPIVNGVVTSIVNLSETLIEMGHEVKIIALSSGIRSGKKDNVYYIGSISAEKIYQGVRIKAMPSIKELREIYAWKPDVIHSQSEFSTFKVAKKISKKLKIPLIHTYHTVYEEYTHYFSPNKKVGKFVAKHLSRNILNKSDFVIAPTTKVKNLLLKYKVKRPIEIIPSGIDLNKFQTISKYDVSKIRNQYKIKDETVLISISRVGKEKNIDLIISFIKKLNDKSIKLIIVGDGPYKKSLEKQVEKLKLQDQIYFTGMISPNAIANYYKVADIFVSASQSETQGLTYIEALATGKPILVKEDDCLKDILINGVNGFSYNEYEEFKSNLNYIRDNIQKINSQTVESVQKYSKENFAINVMNIYDKSRNKIKKTKR